MAKHPAKCPKCGQKLEYESAVDEQMLCPGCGIRLAVPGKTKLSDKADSLLGQTLGEFEIVELLGRGGMGAVYKARQTALDRFVAVKVLPRQFLRDASFVERFGREARAAAAVSHSNIVQVFTVGQDKGFQFIAMELVEGESLADVLKRDGPLPADRALELMRQVASALAAAHAKGVVHRDIKPSNILLTPRGDAKVADFGLAKRAGTDVSVTQAGQALGTPLYFPPELARGEKADPRSDLYSLGATFYQVLSGKPPFECDTVAELVARHLEATVPPLGEAAPGTPIAVCQIIHRLLRKKPADRFQSADDLLEALSRVPPAGSEPRGRVPVSAGAVGATHRVAPGRGSASPLQAPGGRQPGVPPKGDTTRTQPGGAQHASPADRLAAQSRRRRSLLLFTGLSVASIVLVLLLVLVLGTSSSSRPQATTPLPTPTPSKQGPPTPQTQHPAPSKSAPSPISEETAPPAPIPTSWERAWSEADAKSKALIADQRFGDAATIYENMAKAFEDLRLKDRAQKAQAAIFAQADAAYADLETKAKKLLADKKLDEARSLLRPVLDRFGLPLKAAAARKLLAQVDAAEPEPKEDQWGEWVSLFDGKTLNGWRVPEEGNFARHGKVFVEGAALVLERGEQATGLAWTGEFPNEGYECSLELKPIVLGNAALEVVLPVGALQCDLGVATWDNAVTGLQMIDGQLANNNETTKRFGLQAGRWYQVRIRVTSRKVEAWLDADQVVDMPRAGRTLTLHTDNEPLKPFGLGQGRAVSSVRNIRLRRLKPPAEDPLVFTKWPFDEAEAKRRQEETAKALGVKVEQDIDLGGGVKMTFVLIPAGEFLMGSPPTTSPEQLVKQYGCPVEEFQREFPAHRVRLTKPFWLGKYEVTQEQWTAVLRTNPSVFKDRPKNPVENVDWNEARGFAKALGEKLGKTFRLPTEAEWEYACRAGTASEFYFGNDAAKGADFGWAGAGSTAPVGQKKPNAWGLCDTVGNVWELCEDVYANYESAAQTDPKGAPAGQARVFRGGGWVNLPAYFRSAVRTHISPNARDYSIGIRLVFALEPVKPQVQPPARTETPQPAETRAAAYAPESDKVWDLFRQRKYTEAETRLAELAKRPEFKATAPLKADAEAAALLKDFWAAAEKGLGEAKGRFLSVAGTSGTLEEAKDGVIRIRTAQGKPEEKELTQLASKQALAYTGLKDKPDPRAKLMVGVFFLADGVFLDDAGKALAAASEGPSVALYKERLNAQLMAAAEAAAQKAWLRIEEEATGKLDPAKAARLIKSLSDFAKAHGETKFHKGLGDKLAALKTRIEDSLVFTEWPFDEKEAKRRQKVTADVLGVKIEQDIEIAKGVKMSFVLIPAGEFLMGSPPTTSPEKLAAAYGGPTKEYEGESPQHRVKISRPFWIGKYEVTQEQWTVVLATNPSYFGDKAKNPVEQVDWNQFHGFANLLSEKLGKTFRLPTEAEWEYACRAGTATEFYFGNDAAKLSDFGWVGVNSTAPVGMKKPNAWGLYDMAGSVWEWCEDWYGKYEGGAQTDPKGAPAGSARVLRGGSWGDGPGRCRSAFRGGPPLGGRGDNCGFRLVLAPGPR